MSITNNTNNTLHGVKPLLVVKVGSAEHSASSESIEDIEKRVRAAIKGDGVLVINNNVTFETVYVHEEIDLNVLQRMLEDQSGVDPEADDEDDEDDEDDTCCGCESCACEKGGGEDPPADEKPSDMVSDLVNGFLKAIANRGKTDASK